MRVIYKALRVLNLLWLVFSIFLVEFSLNFNNITAVLGGPHDNELHLPSQLLPLLIGAFGFVRIIYLLFEQTRSPGDAEPSVAHPPTPPRQARTMHLADALHVFSPAMARDSLTTTRDDDDIDAMERHRPRRLRYLVAWLPWLSLLPAFRSEDGEPAHKREKRLSDLSTAAGDKERVEREAMVWRDGEHGPDEERGVMHGSTV